MTHQIVVRDIPSQRVATIRTRMRKAEIGRDMSAGFGEVAQAAASAAVAIDGLAFAIHHEMDAEKVDVEFGFPVAGEVGSGRVHSSILEGCRAACTVHSGPYDEIGDTYEAVAAWIGEQGLQVGGPPREVYLNEPGEGVVPLTEVQMPIA